MKRLLIRSVVLLVCSVVVVLQALGVLFAFLVAGGVRVSIAEQDYGEAVAYTMMVTVVLLWFIWGVYLIRDLIEFGWPGGIHGR